MKPNLSWPVAFVAVATIVGVVVLAALGKDTESLVTLVTLGISALLYGKVNAVEQNTNGNAHTLLQTVREAQRILATLPPAPPGPPPAPPGPPTGP